MKEKMKLSLKESTFSELKERLAKAHSHKFFFESIYLISILIENRVERLIKVAGITIPSKTSRTKTNVDNILSLSEKLKVIKKLLSADKADVDLLNNHFDERLIVEVENWLKERNTILNGMTKICPEPAGLAELVFSGEMVLTNLAYSVKQYKKEAKDTQ